MNVHAGSRAQVIEVTLCTGESLRVNGPLIQEWSQSVPLQGILVSLAGIRVIAGTLHNKKCEENCRKGEGEGYGIVNIDAPVRGRLGWAGGFLVTVIDQEVCDDTRK